MAAPKGNRYGAKNFKPGERYPDSPHVDYYFNDFLRAKLNEAKDKVLNTDDDRLYIITGQEGGGKSVFTMQCARVVDPTFDKDRVVYNLLDWYKNVDSCKRGQAIMHDEAFRDMSSAKARTNVGNDFIETLMECRQKNLMLFVVVPNAKKLADHIREFRCNGLFYIYRRKMPNGREMRFFKLWSGKMIGKVLRDVAKVGADAYRMNKPLIHGPFINHYVIDEKEYREKKSAAFDERLKDRIKRLKEAEKTKKRNEKEKTYSI